VGVARKWIFPILRLLILAAIAAALVKVAFFPDLGAESDVDVPSAEIVEPQVAVTLGTVQNDVTLNGTVAADAAVPIKATLAGVVRTIAVTAGQQVSAGTPILTLRGEVPSLDPAVAPVLRTVTVVSPIAGTLSDFPTLVGQLFSVGDDLGKVAPSTFHVSGSLAPEQLYRLLVQPTEAEVIITGGPAPFTCTGLTISTPLAGAPGGEGSGGPTVSCAVPSDVRVFPGLAAQLVLAGGIAENVLTVPITAVEGVADSGNVYVVLPDGSTEARLVTLGLNDGYNVEVKEGLEEGDMILEFVPGAGAVDPGFGGRPIDPGVGLPEDCISVEVIDGVETCTEFVK
jgi:macrolide-specific efflux system membrane fusion protein